MAFIANSTQAFVGSYPVLYATKSGLDQYVGDGTLNDGNPYEDIDGTRYVNGSIIEEASAAIWTGNNAVDSVAISTDFGLIGIVEDIGVGGNANTANVHLITTSGDEILNFRIPASTTSTFGGYDTFAMGNGRMVIGDRGHNGTNGRALVYDYEGNLLHTLTLQTSSGLSSGWEYGVCVAIGCGRIVVGAPTWYSGGYQNGIFEIWDLDGNYINNVTPPYNAASFSYSYASFLNSNVQISDGRIMFLVPDDDGIKKGELIKVCDLDGNLIYNHRIPFQGTGSNKRIDAGSGIVSITSGSTVVPGSPIWRFDDIRFGSRYHNSTDTGYATMAIGAVTGGEVTHGFAGYQGRGQCAIGFGRYVIGHETAQVQTTDTGNYSDAGVVNIFDLNDRDFGSQPIRRFISPASDREINGKFGHQVAIGYDYVVMTGEASGSTNAKVYCEEIPTAITPFDIANQQSYGY